jgi:nicotinamide riboside kinase
MYVMKVWCEVAFQECHTWILKQIARRQYEFYLLCDVDLPWVKDGLREYPDLVIRKRLFKMYRDSLINSGVMWSEITGTDVQRMQMAIGILDTAFGKK